jgi:hypothetical protein
MVILSARREAIGMAGEPLLVADHAGRWSCAFERYRLEITGRDRL